MRVRFFDEYRPKLAPRIRHYNQQSLKARAFFNDRYMDIPGPFSEICGAELTADGYVEIPCEFCYGGPIIATMAEDGDLIVAKSVTKGAFLVEGHLVLCRICYAGKGRTYGKLCLR